MLLPLLLYCRLAGIGELKMFVGLCKDRTAGLSVAPSVTLQRHLRTLCLLLLVLAADAAGWLLLLWQYQQRQLNKGVCLLFALDLAVTAVDAAKTTMRYARFGCGVCQDSLKGHCSTHQPPGKASVLQYGESVQCSLEVQVRNNCERDALCVYHHPSSTYNAAACSALTETICSCCTLPVVFWLFQLRCLALG